MSSSRPGTTGGDRGRCAPLTVVALAIAASIGVASCAGAATDRADAIVGVQATACGEPIRGVGVVVAADRVLTNAHVVAGVDAIEVAGREGELLGFDADRDLALVAVAGLDRPTVGLTTVTDGDEGTLIAIDATGSTVRHAFVVRRTIRATGEDIYRRDGADRRALEVEVEFAPGWSGAGLFDDRGRLVGVAFAESRRIPGVAYAVADTEIADFLASVDNEPVDAGPCL